MANHLLYYDLLYSTSTVVIERNLKISNHVQNTLLSNLKAEIEEFDLILVEHKQGHLITKKGQKRKRPSMWSANQISSPTTVEEAAAEKFHGDGYNVAIGWGNNEIFLLLLQAYSHLSYGAKDIDPNFLELEISRKFKACPEGLRLDETLNTRLLSEALDIYIARSISRFVYHMLFDAVANSPHGVMSANDVDYFKRGEILEKEYCNKLIYGANDRSILKEKILLAIQQIPKNFFAQYFLGYLDEINSGRPDLFLWNETEYKFVEVKSPNDRVHENQAKFYAYRMKMAGLRYNVARILPMAYTDL
jgi:hypothetical protein